MKAKIESIIAILNKIIEGLKCYNFRDAVKKDSVTFETILCCYSFFDWDYGSFTQALAPTFSDDGINIKGWKLQLLSFSWISWKLVILMAC